MDQSTISITDGVPQPFGVSVTEQGINFAIYSKHATDVVLCLFSFPNQELVHIFPLDPIQNRTGDVWHICIGGLQGPLLYAYRMAKKKGRVLQTFYDEKRHILDPYARGVAGRAHWGDCQEEYHPFGLVLSGHEFDWEEDRKLKIPTKDLVIYEMHVRGFTQHPSSGCQHPGSYLGIIEKIPYLLELGVNAVKLMPIQEFNECEYDRVNPETNERLMNYWGYSTVNYFSPMARYAHGQDFDSTLNEFKQMVKELHKNGIEVILDIVFNHTAEGNDRGPIYSFKGIDAPVYYIMDKKMHHQNYTGCGNTVNCNHPIVRQLIRECLQFWVTEMHVDGFRFDLAAIMMRGLHGELLEKAPIIEELSHDPVLADTKLIAEPWDAGGLYCLGGFFSEEERWSEWNDKYRDSVRKFIKGDLGEKRTFARRICGSQDIFPIGRSPASSLNFVTAHDGFTLRDLVTYNEKHNLANGEENRDGHSSNVSWNCGKEGPSDKPEVIHLRERQIRNFILALMVSQGVPMLLMGDEYGHTRNGNNNTWCHDNELNWFLWDKLQENAALHRFVKGMIHLRRNHEIFRLGKFLTDKEIDWHGINPNDPDWDGETHVLAFVLKDQENHQFFYLAFNMHYHPFEFHLPPPPNEGRWKMRVNTGSEPPNDFYESDQAPEMEHDTIELQSHSAIMLSN